MLPVVNALVFLFRTPGLSYQETAIAMLGEQRRYLPRVVYARRTPERDPARLMPFAAALGPAGKLVKYTLAPTGVKRAGRAQEAGWRAPSRISSPSSRSKVPRPKSPCGASSPISATPS